MAYQGKKRGKSTLSNDDPKTSMSRMDYSKIRSTTTDAFWPTSDSVASTGETRGFYNAFYAKYTIFSPIGDDANSVARTLYNAVVYPALNSNYGRISGNNSSLSNSNLLVYFEIIAQALHDYYQLEHLMAITAAGVQNPSLQATGSLLRSGVRSRLQTLRNVLSSLPCPRGLHEFMYWLSQFRWLSPEKFAPIGAFFSFALGSTAITDALVSGTLDSEITQLTDPALTGVIQQLRAMSPNDYWRINIKQVPSDVSYDGTWHNIWTNVGTAFKNANATSRSFIPSTNFELKCISQNEKWSGVEDSMLAVTIGASATTSNVWQPGFMTPQAHVDDANAGNLVGSVSNLSGQVETVRNISAIANSDTIEAHSGASGSMIFRNVSACGKQRLQWSVDNSRQSINDFLRMLYDIDALDSMPSRF